MIKRIIAFVMVGVFSVATLSPASAAKVENNPIGTTLGDEFQVGDVVELEDGSKLNYYIKKESKKTTITAEVNNEKAELTVHDDNSMTLKEIHPDGTIKYYDSEDLKDIFVIKDGKSKPSKDEVVIQESDNSIIQPLVDMSTIIDIGNKDLASGKWKITHEGYAEFAPYGLLTAAIATFIVNLMVSNLSSDAESGNKLTTQILVSAASAFIGSLTITTGKIYMILYQYKDVDPIVNGNYYRTQLLFFKDSAYNNRLKTISYYWGVYRN